MSGRKRIGSIWAYALIGAVGIVALWLWGAGVQYRTAKVLEGDSKADATAVAGQIGDSFGMVNALFSGLAFLGVVVALLIQSEEMRQAEAGHTESQKLQNDSIKSLSKQADSLFMAAYLNALVAVRDTPAVEELPPDQWEAADRVRLIVEKLNPKAAEVWGDLKVANLRANYVVRSIQKVIDTLNLHIPPDYEANPNQMLQALSVHRYLVNGLRPRLQELLVEIPYKHELQARTIFAALADAENQVKVHTVTNSAQVENIKRFWGACRQLIDQLNQLNYQVRTVPAMDQAVAEDRRERQA